MTDPRLLALARAVYPESVEHDEETGEIVVGPCCASFDPRNNDSQAWAVLAWLLNQKLPHRYDCRIYTAWIEVSGHGIYKMISDKGEGVAIQSWKHDGTDSGLRAAATEAGMRVVG